MCRSHFWIRHCWNASRRARRPKGRRLHDGYCESAEYLHRRGFERAAQDKTTDASKKFQLARWMCDTSLMLNHCCDQAQFKLCFLPAALYAEAEFLDVQ